MQRSGPDLYGAGIRKWKLIVMSAAIVAAVLWAGLITAASLQALGSPGDWADRANVGDSFGVVNAIVSGLALAALVVTLRLQSRELALQRSELGMQRESLDRSRMELKHSADASLRMLHVGLIRMSINDPSLAAVWPPLEPGASHEKEPRYLYANLIFQHVWQGAWMGDLTDEQMGKRLRYLFTSPLMREYWRAASKARMYLAPDTKEYRVAAAGPVVEAAALARWRPQPSFCRPEAHAVVKRHEPRA